MRFPFLQLLVSILTIFIQFINNQRLKPMNREPIEGEGHDLGEYNKYQDTFDVFINFIVRRSPTVFVLINMTLMIWLVQTIYSSGLDSIPRSIYFLDPYFNAQPIVNLYTSKSLACKDDFDQIILKTFPAIKEDLIKRSNLTHWDLDPIVFCAQYRKQSANFSKQCNTSQQYCSGYCVDNQNQCPITGIKKIRSTDIMPAGYEQFYLTSDGTQRYILTRQSKNTFIVGLSVQYQQKCANDFKYFDKYQTFRSYWNDTKNCGNEGSLPGDLYRTFDYMTVKTFLFNNNLWSPTIQATVKESLVYLGTMNLIKFTNKTTQCNKAQYLSTQLSKYLVEDPVKPTFTKSMLIIAFIFFTLSWAWLVGYYCFSGSGLAKNKLMILMLTIELIVVAFLYSQNLNMFLTEDVMSQIANCIQTQIQASSNWSFGIINSSPFISIIYVCTCFLLLQLICQIIDKYMYVPYYQSEINPNPPQTSQRWFWN